MYVNTWDYCVRPTPIPNNSECPGSPASCTSSTFELEQDQRRNNDIDVCVYISFPGVRISGERTELQTIKPQWLFGNTESLVSWVTCLGWWWVWREWQWPNPITLTWPSVSHLFFSKRNLNKCHEELTKLLKSRQVLCSHLKLAQCNNACMYIAILLYWRCTNISTHTGPRQSSGPGSGLYGWLAWLALNQAGRWLEAQRRPSHHYVWVASSLLLRSKWRSRRAETSTERGANCHWGACLLWLIINYCVVGSKASVSVATSSVKHACAPATCRDARRLVLLTALWFGCPLVELELWE